MLGELQNVIVLAAPFFVCKEMRRDVYTAFLGQS